MCVCVCVYMIVLEYDKNNRNNIDDKIFNICIYYGVKAVGGRIIYSTEIPIEGKWTFSSSNFTD